MIINVKFQNLKTVVSLLVLFTLVSLAGIYLLSGYLVAPFQKVYFNETISKFQNGGTRNYYLEFITRPELRFDTQKILGKIKVQPPVQFDAKFKDGSLIVDFGQTLKPETRYQVSFEKGTDLPALDRYSYTFNTPKPTLVYLQEKNTAGSAIVMRQLGLATKTLVSRPFLQTYSITPEYLIYTYKDNAEIVTPLKIAIYNIEAQTTREVAGRYDQFFDIITDEISNQAVVSKKDSSYELLDLATGNSKKLANIDGRYNSFLAFASPGYLIYNTVVDSSRTVFYDIGAASGTLIGKYSRVIGVDSVNSKVCLVSSDTSDKIFRYGSDGGTTETVLPLITNDDIVASQDCLRIATKTATSFDTLGITITYFDTNKEKPEQITQEKDFVQGEFVMDNSGTYFGYNLSRGLGKDMYTEFVLHDHFNQILPSPLKNISGVVIY
jgi:hypothetical protein